MSAYNPDANSTYSCCDNRTVTTPIASYVIENVAELRAMTTSLAQLNEVAQTLGYYEAGDGGGNFFYWDSINVNTDNNGTIIKAADAATGRWLSLYPDVTFRKFGAKGDGVTNDGPYLNDALEVAALSTRHVKGESGTYLSNEQIVIPLDMTGGIMEGNGQFTTIIAGPTFPSNTSLIKGNLLLSVFTFQEMAINSNGIAKTGLDLTREPKSSVRNRVMNVHVIGIPSNATGFNMDGCEDSYIIGGVAVKYDGAATGVKSVQWHVPDGNLFIYGSTLFDPLYLAYQQASIHASTLGTIVADGNAIALEVSGGYMYPDATLMSNFYTDPATNNHFFGITLSGTYLTAHIINNSVVFKGKYYGGVTVSQGAINAEGLTYSIFSADTVAVVGRKPVFSFVGDPLVQGTVAGTPGTDIYYNGLKWATYAPAVTSATGTITNASLHYAAFEVTGKTVQLRLAMTIDVLGTAGGDIRIGLPIPASTVWAQSFTGFEDAIDGAVLKVWVEPSGTYVRIKKYDNTFYAANGYTYFISGSYEID